MKLFHLEHWRARALGCVLTSVPLGACADAPCSNPQENTLGELTDWERAYLEQDDATIPEPAFLSAEDGLPLAYHEWQAAGRQPEDPVYLFVPGSSAYAELYAAIGAGLAARGITTRIIDVRGHGRSTCSSDGECSAPPSGGYPSEDDSAYWVGRPGDSLDEDQIIRDLGRHVAALRSQFPGARLVLSGHSSGGGVVSRYVEHAGLATVDSVALLAPFNHPDQAQNVDVSEQLCADTAGSLYAQVDLGALGDALRGNVHRYVLNFVKEPELTTPLDTLRYSYTTVVGMAADDPDDFLAAYAEPVLWVAASEDALLGLDSSRAQFERMPGGGAFVVVNDTSHVGLSWSSGVAQLLATWATDPMAVASAPIEPLADPAIDPAAAPR